MSILFLIIAVIILWSLVAAILIACIDYFVSSGDGPIFFFLLVFGAVMLLAVYASTNLRSAYAKRPHTEITAPVQIIDGTAWAHVRGKSFNLNDTYGRNFKDGDTVPVVVYHESGEFWHYGPEVFCFQGLQ